MQQFRVTGYASLFFLQGVKHICNLYVLLETNSSLHMYTYIKHICMAYHKVLYKGVWFFVLLEK